VLSTVKSHFPLPFPNSRAKIKTSKDTGDGGPSLHEPCSAEPGGQKDPSAGTVPRAPQETSPCLERAQSSKLYKATPAHSKTFFYSVFRICNA